MRETHGDAARAERPFEPHLTLGRVRDARTAGDLAARFAGAAFPDVAFDVTTVIVVQSTLSPKGSRYAALGHYALTAPGMRPRTGVPRPSKEGRSST